MKLLFVTIAIIGISCPVLSQEICKTGDFELSTGVSTLLYQSVYSSQVSPAFETAVRGQVTDLWDWQIGARLGFSPILPDVFVRILAAPDIGIWLPSVGFELGFTNRARFEEGEKLLQETRAAMEGDISHFYVAGHSTPLSFKLWNRWRLSVLELNIGTHIINPGRTIRVQIGIFSIGRKI